MINGYFLILNYLYFLFLLSELLILQTNQNGIALRQYQVSILSIPYFQRNEDKEYIMLTYRVMAHRLNIRDNNNNINHKYIQSQADNNNDDAKHDQVYQERYVEYQFGVGGLANKIFGLVSSYIIAALLNATFIRIHL